MLKCPHCQEPGISVLRKLCLGPAMPATCKACGKKVGVPYTSMLALVPFLAALFGSALVGSFGMKVVVWIAGAVVMGFIHMRWVPLERR